MKWLNWLPWRFVISRMARSQGFIDPLSVINRVRGFAQPSEVTEPVELMRAGLILQARALVNAHVIQHNLDWVWPHWVTKQFDPRCESFLPRGFALTHANLTHRNWTAVGRPDDHHMPLVDPRGLVTPLFDGWSLDTWIVPDEGDPLLPSREADVEQRIPDEIGLSVVTTSQREGRWLQTRVDTVTGENAVCRLLAEGRSSAGGWLVVSLRPTNPEGVSFIDSIEVRGESRDVLRVDGDDRVRFVEPPDRLQLSEYAQGDVLRHVLDERSDARAVECKMGMASAAALFRLEPGQARTIRVEVPLTGPTAHPEPTFKRSRAARREEPARRETWEQALSGTTRMNVPDERIERLFSNAVRNLVLFSPDEAFPGPFTSKRFWFRDSAFLVNALLTVGLEGRASRVLSHYPQRQQLNGFFRSQEGEWDANGQALWTIDRHHRLTGVAPTEPMLDAVRKGVEWIAQKRLPSDLDAPHAGLLPAGFSAEHLGPNDHYYWDDFWSVGGLRAAASLLERFGEEDAAGEAREEAESLLAAIDRSLELTESRRRHPGVPASPYRRMDGGAIGSMAASHPAQVWAPGDERLMATCDFLVDNHLIHGAYFHEIIHSGINTYLTLQIAETLLRAGDERHVDMVRSLAALASPTGNWPEAIHPATRGGCMGDGQHAWAAAEWVLMLRNWFVREEGERLVLASGLPRAWLEQDETMRLGPTPTPHGPVSVEVRPGAEDVEVRWNADWRGDAPEVEIALAGLETVRAPGDARQVRVRRAGTRRPEGAAK